MPSDQAQALLRTLLTILPLWAAVCIFIAKQIGEDRYDTDDRLSPRNFFLFAFISFTGVGFAGLWAIVNMDISSTIGIIYLLLLLAVVAMVAFFQKALIEIAYPDIEPDNKDNDNEDAHEFPTRQVLARRRSRPQYIQKNDD